ncbi:helix-turn-helix domain-containing protein [Bacillus mobilis]|uniref:helix-turn-helix domain-containing protein n=1 Tax=Bacillus mobilis TaxID=2026190 RepID=UPI003D65D64E
MAGRRNKYETHVRPRLDEIKEWAEQGLTESEMQKLLGVSHNAFNNYKNEYSELNESLKQGKEISDDIVEQSLYKNAIGYYYEEEAVTNKGDIVSVKKYSKPNTTAQIFWLKNRRRDQWRDKQDIEHSGGMDFEINLGFEEEFGA